METPDTNPESRAQARLRQTYRTLTTDSIREDYESEVVRKLRNRLELLEAGTEPGDDTSRNERDLDVERRRQLVLAQLAELESMQSDSLTSDNPKIGVIIVKPDAPTKGQLSLLYRHVLAHQMAVAKETDEPTIREGIREGARTTILLRSMYDTEAEVQQALKGILVNQLMILERKTPDVLAYVSETDPELQLTEEEQQRFQITDLMEGAELARVMRERDAARSALIAEKRTQIVTNRLEEAEEHRQELMVLDEEALLDRITDIEVMTMAILRSKDEETLHYMLFCVRDPRKPQWGYARGERFIKGHAPFFNSVEEVRDVAKGMTDFWNWLQVLKSKLDYLTEEDLFALSEYEPFRPAVQLVLGGRQHLEQMAALLGAGG